MNDIAGLFLKRFALKFPQFFIFLDLIFVGALNCFDLNLFSVDRVTELFLPHHLGVEDFMLQILNFKSIFLLDVLEFLGFFLDF